MPPNNRTGSKRVTCEGFERPNQISNLDICHNRTGQIRGSSMQPKATVLQPDQPPNLNISRNRQLGVSTNRPKATSLQLEQPSGQPFTNPNQPNATTPSNSICNVAAYDASNDISEIGDSTDNVIEIVGNKKKRVRGATCMPKVWGQQPDELVVVSFNDLGQPKDQGKSSTLSHFLGTIARNGRYCPLNYKDWRVMPSSYKEEMLRIVKARFQLPPGHESYILRSINKKWRNWKSFVKSLNFNPDISIDQQMTEIPERVNEDQYKSLVEYWMSDKSKKRSDKNKDSRDNLKFFHRMGKNSFAVVKERMRDRLGRYPTRAELFEECYCKEGGSSSDEIKKAVEKMKEMAPLDSQTLDGNHVVHNSDDLFSKVMGKDKDGQLRMYGLGVTPLDVYGEKPSRATLLRQAMEYKTMYLEAIEKYDMLNAKFDHLSANTQSCEQLETHNSPNKELGSENAPNTTSNGQDNFGYIPEALSSGQVGAQSPLSIPNDQRSLGSNSVPVCIKGGSYVVMKSIANVNEIVATGIVDKMDNVRANGTDLGPDFCQVVIQYPVKKDARLIFPYNHIQTIGNAIGVPVAWPLSLVALDLEDDEYY